MSHEYVANGKVGGGGQGRVFPRINKAQTKCISYCSKWPFRKFH